MPLSKLTPMMNPSRSTGIVSATTVKRSAIISPRSSATRRIGVISSRSKYPSWMSVTSADAREIPVTAKMIATGSWNARKSDT